MVNWLRCTPVLQIMRRTPTYRQGCGILRRVCVQSMYRSSWFSYFCCVHCLFEPWAADTRPRWAVPPSQTGLSVPAENCSPVPFPPAERLRFSQGGKGAKCFTNCICSRFMCFRRRTRDRERPASRPVVVWWNRVRSVPALWESVSPPFMPRHGNIMCDVPSGGERLGSTAWLAGLTRGFWTGETWMVNG